MLNFTDWLKKETTSTSSVSGGGSFTGDVANFSRRLFEFPVERGIKKKKKMHENDFQTTGASGFNANQQQQPQQSQQQWTQPQQQPQPQPQQQAAKPLKGQGFAFGGSGTSQKLYNQGITAFMQLAKRQPKFANEIQNALQQLKQVFINSAKSQNNQQQDDGSYTLDDYEKALDSLK